MTSRQNFVTPYLISLLLPDLELFRCKDLVLEIAATWHSLMKYKNITLVYKVVPGSYKNTIKIKKNKYFMLHDAAPGILHFPLLSGQSNHH